MDIANDTRNQILDNVRQLRTLLSSDRWDGGVITKHDDQQIDTIVGKIRSLNNDVLRNVGLLSPTVNNYIIGNN